MRSSLKAAKLEESLYSASVKENSKVSEIARKLFPGEGSQVQLLKKRKPGEGNDGPAGHTPEGGLIKQIDKDLSLAIVPAGMPLHAVHVCKVPGFDTGQGNEKKLRCEAGTNTLCPLLGDKSDVGLPFQPYRDQ